MPLKPTDRLSGKPPKRHSARERESPLPGPFYSVVFTGPSCNDQEDFSHLPDEEKMKLAISELRTIAVTGDNQPLSWLYHMLSRARWTRTDVGKLLPRRSTVEPDRRQLIKGHLVRVLYSLKQPPLSWSNDRATRWLVRAIDKSSDLAPLLPKSSPEKRAKTIKNWVNLTQRQTRYREGFKTSLWQEIQNEKEAEQAIDLIGELARTTSV